MAKTPKRRFYNVADIQKRHEGYFFSNGGAFRSQYQEVVGPVGRLFLMSDKQKGYPREYRLAWAHNGDTKQSVDHLSDKFFTSLPALRRFASKIKDCRYMLSVDENYRVIFVHNLHTGHTWAVYLQEGGHYDVTAARFLNAIDPARVVFWQTSRYGRTEIYIR